MQPFCAPRLRSRRVSIRVSMSAIATVPSRARYSARVMVLAKVGRQQRQVLDDQASGEHLGGLDVFGVDAVVADVRIGQRDDLPAVARVGEDFLVAGQRGVEDDFAGGVAGGTDRGAVKDRAVCERKDGGRQDRQQDRLRGGCPARLLRTPETGVSRRACVSVVRCQEGWGDGGRQTAELYGRSGTLPSHPPAQTCSATMPARAICASSLDFTPLTPTAPTQCPSTMIGTPPSSMPSSPGALRNAARGPLIISS